MLHGELEHFTDLCMIPLLLLSHLIRTKCVEMEMDVISLNVNLSQKGFIQIIHAQE